MAFTMGSLSDRVVVLGYFTELIGLDHWKDKYCLNASSV